MLVESSPVHCNLKVNSLQEEAMNNQRNRAISVGTALANLPRPHGIRRIQGTMASLTPKSVRIVLLGCGGVGKTGKLLLICKPSLIRCLIAKRFKYFAVES